MRHASWFWDPKDRIFRWSDERIRSLYQFPNILFCFWMIVFTGRNGKQRSTWLMIRRRLLPWWRCKCQLLHWFLLLHSMWAPLFYQFKCSVPCPLQLSPCLIYYVCYFEYILTLLGELMPLVRGCQNSHGMGTCSAIKPSDHFWYLPIWWTIKISYYILGFSSALSTEICDGRLGLSSNRYGWQLGIYF